MTKEKGPSDRELSHPLAKFIPAIVRLIVLLVMVAIPLKIISYGFLPPSDVLRHAAKAVSNKVWPEILVLNPVYQIDHEFGWDLFLREIFLSCHCTPTALVQLSVVLLFVLVGWSAIPWLKRPEAWLIALIAAALTSDLVMRLTLGRPFLVTMTGLLTILFYWKAYGAEPPTRGKILFIAGIITLCIFGHGVWYLWLLPIAAFLLARQFRWGLDLALAWLIGVVVGSCLTGHPFEYCREAVAMAVRPFALHATQSTLVTELQPSTGEVFALIIAGGLVILRNLAKLNVRPLTSDPIFWLACLCWVLSFKAARFTEDWGWPALLVWISCDLQQFFQTRFAANSLQRLGLACGLALIAFLVFTNDLGSRWTQNQSTTYLEESNQALQGWLPEPNGIFYSPDMTLFYQTFFKNPNADWRYLLGFEPTLMPDDDFNIYRNILSSSYDSDSFQPWIKKMTQADRLVLRGNETSAPNLPQLEWGEWGHGANGIWIGRLPRLKPTR